MHQCCEQCFLQKNIREYINNRRRIGNCCYCGRKNVAIAQTREVGIFIRESLDKAQSLEVIFPTFFQNMVLMPQVIHLFFLFLD